MNIFINLIKRFITCFLHIIEISFHFMEVFIILFRSSHVFYQFLRKISLIFLMLILIVPVFYVQASSPFITQPVKLDHVSSTTNQNSLSSTSSSSDKSAYQLDMDFGTYFGTETYSNSIAVDSQGNSYITGYTSSLNIPTKNAYSKKYGGGAFDAFIAKFSSNGSLIFSTYLGGSGKDFGSSIAVDSQGNSYITGYTTSINFPNQSPTVRANYAVFVAKFNATGSLLFSTVLGGSNSDLATSIAVDKSDNIYITGFTASSNFPIKNAYNSTFSGSNDLFVMKLNATGSILYSTFLGAVPDFPYPALTVDESGNCFITGVTAVSVFPSTLVLAPPDGSADVFVAKLNATGSLVFSTLIGGSNSDYANAIILTKHGNILVTGRTDSTDFPMKNAYNDTYGGDGDVFLAKFNSTGSLLFSTYLGGSITDEGDGLAIGSNGNYFVSGGANSVNFPVINAYNKTNGLNGGFLAEFNTTGSLIFSMTLGSWVGFTLAVDSANNIYLTGTTGSTFPLKHAIDNSSYLGSRTILAKFSAPLLVLVTQPSPITNLVNFIIDGVIWGSLIGVIIIALVLSVEYNNYLGDKDKNPKGSEKSFRVFFVSKLKHKSKNNKLE